MVVKDEDLQSVIIAGQLDKEVRNWRMTKREVEERKKIQPGLEIVAINGRLLEPRTLLQAQNLVLCGGATVDMTLRRLSDVEGEHMRIACTKNTRRRRSFRSQTSESP